MPGRAVPSFLSGRYSAVKVRKKLYVTVHHLRDRGGADGLYPWGGADRVAHAHNLGGNLHSAHRLDDARGAAPLGYHLGRNGLSFELGGHGHRVLGVLALWVVAQGALRARREARGGRGVEGVPRKEGREVRN